MAEHAFKTIGKDLKENSIRNIVILYGREKYLVNWAKNLLIDTYVNGATRELDYTAYEAEASEPDEIKAACETVAMFSEKKVVSVYFRGRSRYRIEELVQYCCDIPKESLLIIISDEETLDTATLKAVSQTATVYDFNRLDERLLKAFIGKRVKAGEKTIKTSVADELIELTGYFHRDSDYTLSSLENDLNKVISLAEGEEITKENVEDGILGSADRNIFEMVEAVSRNRKDIAYRLLHNICASGESFYRIYSMVVTQFETLLCVKELRDRGMNSGQIQKTLKIHEYRLKKTIPVADRYSCGRLKKILINAYEIDSDIKSGVIGDRLALEMFIAEI